MKHTSPAPAIGVWLFLVTATLCSGWLAEHHGFAGRWTAVAVMLVAALKGRAVILYFMELTGAPRGFRAMDLAVPLADRGLMGNEWWCLK